MIYILRFLHQFSSLFVFHGPRSTHSFVGPAKSFENFGSVDPCIILSGRLRRFASERANLASGTFGHLSFPDVWTISVWHHLNDDFWIHVTGKESGSQRDTSWSLDANDSCSYVTGNEFDSRPAMSRFLRTNFSTRQCLTGLYMLAWYVYIRSCKLTSHCVPLLTAHIFIVSFFSFSDRGFSSDSDLSEKMDHFRTLLSLRSAPTHTRFASFRSCYTFRESAFSNCLGYSAMLCFLLYFRIGATSAPRITQLLPHLISASGFLFYRPRVPESDRRHVQDLIANALYRFLTSACSFILQKSPSIFFYFRTLLNKKYFRSLFNSSTIHDLEITDTTLDLSYCFEEFELNNNRYSAYYRCFGNIERRIQNQAISWNPVIRENLARLYNAQLKW